MHTYNMIICVYIYIYVHDIYIYIHIICISSCNDQLINVSSMSVSNRIIPPSELWATSLSLYIYIYIYA